MLIGNLSPDYVFIWQRRFHLCSCLNSIEVILILKLGSVNFWKSILSKRKGWTVLPSSAGLPSLPTNFQSFLDWWRLFCSGSSCGTSFQEEVWRRIWRERRQCRCARKRPARFLATENPKRRTNCSNSSAWNGSK